MPPPPFTPGAAADPCRGSSVRDSAWPAARWRCGRAERGVRSTESPSRGALKEPLEAPPVSQGPNGRKSNPPCVPTCRVDTVTDHLANERTFLAWVRTAIAIMALGFVVARFGLFLREIAGATSTGSSPISEAVGVFLVVAGAVVLLLAQVRFRRVSRELETGTFLVHTELETIMTALLILVAIGLALYLLGA